MSNKLTRYQQTLLDQVILQSIAESMRDAIKPQLCPTNDLTPLMEINVNVDTIKIENNIFNDADTSKNENKNNVTIRNIEDDLFGTCFYNSDDDTNVWDPLNSSEADSIKSDDNYESENTNNKEDKSSDINSSSSPHKNLELNTRRREEECLSPELGVPHPRILRRLKIEFK